MSVLLPAPLQDAIARFADDVAPKEIASRAAALSANYRASAPSDAAIANTGDVAAYLTTRLPATYAAMTAAFEAVKERAPLFAPARLLDAGSGPGTASWAAAEIWPFESVTMFDRNPHLLAAARFLAESSAHPSLASAQFISGDLDANFPPPFTGEVSREARRRGERHAPDRPDHARAVDYDLVLAGYTFAEIPAHVRDRALANLWDACRGILVIVEPGTPKGFANVLACRTRLLAVGARIVAPCPGTHPCPIVAPDWCHFAERLPRSRAHMRAKAASVPFEDERFSYLAVAREGIGLTPIEARIVAAPQLSKPGARLRLCTQAGLEERVVFKRDKPAYKAISRKKWGDAL